MSLPVIYVEIKKYAIMSRGEYKAYNVRLKLTKDR